MPPPPCRPLLVVLAAAWLLGALAACGPGGGAGPSGSGPGATPQRESATPSGSGSATASAAPTTDPDTPLGWGPTVGELEEAERLVADWTPARLAGQLIVGRYYGTDAEEPAALVAEHHLAGIQMTSGNIVDRAQVLATTRAVGRAVAEDGRDFPAVVGVDQEGGVVSHLDGIATVFPPFAAAGLVVSRAPEQGTALVRDAARTTGLELRDLGFTWVFAPVADVTIGPADPTIGSRSPSGDPRVAARTVTSALAGYQQAGVVATTKHFPGHGGATGDSHFGLPVIDAGLRELRRRDLVPFRAAVLAGAPAVMTGHLDVTALAPGVPASLAPETYALLRDRLGFDGVSLTDSLGMGAVVSTDRPAVTAVLAGADLLLMPADTAAAARTVTAAVRSGEIPRSRAEEAAARVVAVQRWQQRVARAVPVPGDVAEQAGAASAALSDAAY